MNTGSQASLLDKFVAAFASPGIEVLEWLEARMVTKIMPNVITRLRARLFIGLIPYFLFVFWLTSGILFSVLAVIGITIVAFAFYTDALDGVWARKKNRVTEEGGRLDRIVDKIPTIFFSVPFTIIWIDATLAVLIMLIAFLLIGFTLLGIRAQSKYGLKGINWASNPYGKIKFAAESIYLITLLVTLTSSALNPADWQFVLLRTIGYVGVVLMGTLSLIEHARANPNVIRVFFSRSNEEDL